MRKIITILVILSILLVFFYLTLQKRLYKSIAHETLVGIVRCAASTDKNYDFYLFYFPEGKADFKFAKLKGRDWMFEGEIIKWKRPLNALGFRTVYRPTRLYDSKGNSHSLEKFSRKIFFKLERFLPGIDTTFISAIRQPFKPKVKFGIYATNTGYLVRRIR